MSEHCEGCNRIIGGSCEEDGVAQLCPGIAPAPVGESDVLCECGNAASMCALCAGQATTAPANEWQVRAMEMRRYLERRGYTVDWFAPTSECPEGLTLSISGPPPAVDVAGWLRERCTCTAHDWYSYMNGMFCWRCGCRIGEDRQCGPSGKCATCLAAAAWERERPEPPEPGPTREACKHEWTASHSPLCEYLMDHQATCCCGKWQHDDRCDREASGEGGGE